MIDPLVLLRFGFAAPLVIFVLGHIEQAERDDLVLVTDVAGVVGALEPGWHRVAGLPRAAELLPRARLEPAGREHDDHGVTSDGSSVARTLSKALGAGTKASSACFSRRS